MSKIEDLVTKFHAIQGLTLSDRRRNFNQLLGQLQTDLSSEELVKSFITNLIPKTPLEDEYKLDILVSFNRNEELLQILKAGNPVHIRKVLNTWKFFHSTFQNIDEHALVNDVFAHTSFSTRMKIINRLYKNLNDEEKTDAYFKAIEEKYGLNVASAILPGCSLDLIRTILQKYKLKLTSRHLLDIVKKDPAFLGFYFELLGDNLDFSTRYKPVIKHIAKTNPGYYWELFDKHKLNVKFGRHMTPYVLQANKEILKQDKSASNYFNSRQMVDVIKRDERLFREFVSLQLPRHLDELMFNFSHVMGFIKFVSKREQYHIVSTCFAEIYKKRITDEPGCLPEDLLKIMSISDREVVLDVRVPDDDSLIYLYPPKKSIFMLKEKIKHTSDMEKRAKLLYQLIETCKICNDSDSLLTALKYFLFRHKNDLYVLIEFMRKLIRWPNIEKLSAEHWKCMNELVKILTVSGKYSNREFNFMEKYLQYLWDNELPYDEHIRAFLKYIAENQYQILVFEKQRKHMKTCLEHFAGLIPQIFEGEKYKDMCEQLLNAMRNYNIKNRNNPIFISRYVDIISAVKQKIESNNYYANYMINYIVKFAYEKDGIYDSFFWDHYKEQYTRSMVIWYIKTNPMKILENIDKLFLDLPDTFQPRRFAQKCWEREHMKKLNYFLDDILKLLGKFSHLNIPDKLMTFALTIFQDGSNKQHVFYAVKILSHFGTHGQYSEVFDTADENTRRNLAKNLLNLNPPYAELPLLLKLCTPKYMTVTKRSLYRIVCNTPEKMLGDFFVALYKSSVLVKKHVLNLTIAMATKEGIYNFLKQAGASETALSLKKLIFKLTMKYFVQNPSDMFWDLLKSNINLIDPKDREEHDFLLKLDKIPHTYRLQYIPLIYDLLSRSADRTINKKKYEFLHQIPDNLIADLDLVFTNKSITDTLLNQDLRTSDKEWLGLKFIFHVKKEDQSAMLRVAFDIVKNYIELNWIGPVRINVCDYLKEFCRKFIILNLDLELMDEFQRLWSSIFEREDVFEESLLLDFTSAYVRCSPENKLLEFAEKINEILQNLVGTYGGSVVDLFAESLHPFLAEFACVADNEEKMERFLESFCTAGRSPHAFLVVLMVSVRIRKIYGASVLKMIQECETPAVRIYLKHYAAIQTDPSFTLVC